MAWLMRRENVEYLSVSVDGSIHLGGATFYLSAKAVDDTLNFITMKIKKHPNNHSAKLHEVLEGINMNDNEYAISTDKKRLDLAMIHDFLANESYWAKGIPFEVMKKSIENALCFGVYNQDKQVGFARVVTDYATIAYLCDVFITELYRGRGLGKRLVKTITDHPELTGLRLWVLGTRDAHDLYKKYGFKKIAETPTAERFMAILNPGAYISQRG